MLATSHWPRTHLISILVKVSLRRKRVSLLVVKVLFEVEESVKKDRGHPAALEVTHGYSVGILWYNHVQHLG